MTSSYHPQLPVFFSKLISESPCIISLRVEVSLFVASPEIEDRNAVEVGNWARHKKTFDISLFRFF
jgi:hypothetical protein